MAIVPVAFTRGGTWGFTPVTYRKNKRLSSDKNVLAEQRVVKYRDPRSESGTFRTMVVMQMAARGRAGAAEGLAARTPFLIHCSAPLLIRRSLVPKTLHIATPSTSSIN